jgi:hypothetical protein
MVADIPEFQGKVGIDVPHLCGESDGPGPHRRRREIFECRKDTGEGVFFNVIRTALAQADGQVDEPMPGVSIGHRDVIDADRPNANTCCREGRDLGSLCADGLAQGTHVHLTFEVGRILDMEMRHVSSLTC